MTLLEIRQKAAALSGRRDLIKSNGTDNGMDFFITAALRKLDDWQDTPETRANYIATLSAGGLFVSFQNCRVIEEVWISDLDNDNRQELYKRTLRWVIGNFNSSSGTGVPRYYAPNIVRPCPAQLSADLSAYTDVDFLVTESDFGWKGIAVAPPADEDYQLTVKGKWYSKALSAETDTNWWSDQHPHTLLKAVLYEIEGFYRNFQGVVDFGKFMESDLIGIDNNLAEEEASGDNAMEDTTL